MDIYGCTSRGQLHMVVLHAVVRQTAVTRVTRLCLGIAGSGPFGDHDT